MMERLGFMTLDPSLEQVRNNFPHRRLTFLPHAACRLGIFTAAQGNARKSSITRFGIQRVNSRTNTPSYRIFITRQC